MAEKQQIPLRTIRRLIKSLTDKQLSPDLIKGIHLLLHDYLRLLIKYAEQGLELHNRNPNVRAKYYRYQRLDLDKLIDRLQQLEHKEEVEKLRNIAK